MADLTREEQEVVRRAGSLLAEQFTNKLKPAVTRRLGFVTSVSDDGTASVRLDGDDEPTVGVRLVASCASVAVDDRVVVDSYLNMSIVTGVLAWSLDSGLGTATPTTDGLMSAADKSKLDGISAGAKPYANATSSAAGLMSAADKAKLDGVAAGANKYALPAATASVRGGVRVGSGLKVSGDVLSFDNSAYVRLLWSGQASGNVTLTETAANFRALVLSIGGTDGSPLVSSLCWSPNNRVLSCTTSLVIANGQWRAMNVKYQVSGASMTNTENVQYNGSSVVKGGCRLLYVVGIR